MMAYSQTSCGTSDFANSGKIGVIFDAAVSTEFTYRPAEELWEINGSQLIEGPVKI